MGSLEAVTDAAGKTLTVLGHDPHGERRNDWASQLTPTQIGTLLDGHGERVSRGFTGHEHLDRTGLIHMNGRIYDPRLGRFLSPDPIVGDPTSSQSWNLYSYVGNNPLSYVDPTGLVQAGPMCPVYGPAMCMAGSGAGTGGSTARTATVTFTVYGVAAVPYLRAEPAWTQVWDIDRYVWDVTYDHFWDVAHVPFSRDVTVTIAFEEQSVADRPADDKWTDTDRRAAAASSMVYDDDTGGLLSRLGIEYDPRHGFGAALYKVGASYSYMLAFRGTDQGVDIPANVGQAAGLKASQYEQAIELARQVYRATDGNVIMVGHSLGGGLASAGAYATGARAVTFNAAGLHSRYRRGGPGDIRAHYILGDPLSMWQDLHPLLPRAAGTRILHRYPGPFWHGGLSRHSIDAFPGR